MRNCNYCGVAFEPTRHQKYCSEQHRVYAHRHGAPYANMAEELAEQRKQLESALAINTRMMRQLGVTKSDAA